MQIIEDNSSDVIYGTIKWSQRLTNDIEVLGIWEHHSHTIAYLLGRLDPSILEGHKIRSETTDSVIALT